MSSPTQEVKRLQEALELVYCHLAYGTGSMEDDVTDAVQVIEKVYPEVDDKPDSRPGLRV
jgi:hypothetical protein